MQDIHLVFDNDDGTVAIVTPTPEFLASANFSMEKLVEDSIPSSKPYKVIDKSDIPQDRYFRNAWVWTDKIDIDMERARPIHLNKLRVIRNDMLAKLDVEYQKALEAKDSALQEVISQEKQALRDMPQNVNLDNFDTPESLKEYIPEILK